MENYCYYSRERSRERITCAGRRILIVIGILMFNALSVLVQTNFQMPQSLSHFIVCAMLAMMATLATFLTIYILYHFIFDAIPAFYDWIRGY